MAPDESQGISLENEGDGNVPRFLVVCNKAVATRKPRQLVAEEGLKDKHDRHDSVVSVDGAQGQTGDKSSTCLSCKEKHPCHLAEK